MGAIQELYSGRLLPSENFGFTDNLECKELYNKISVIERQLLSGFNENQKNEYQKIKELKARAENLEQDRMFEYAFKIGCRMIIDIFNQ